MYKHKENIEDILALTPLQEGILFHYLKEPGSNLYFEQLCLEVSGKIDVGLFEKAWNHVIETNEVLRTVFAWENVKKPVQVVLKEHKLQPEHYDLRDREADERPRLLAEIKRKDRENRFDLRCVSFRVTLCQLGEEEHVVIISNHHILYDGWSSRIVLEEFFKTYTALALDRPPVKPPRTRFKEFIRLLQRSDEKKQEGFWREYLDGVDTVTELPVKMKPGGLPGFHRPAVQHLEFDESFVNSMETLAKTGKVTMATILYTAWTILLHRYIDSDDITFGTTVSGRGAKIKGIEDMVGLFINTLPLRVSNVGAKTVEDLVRGISQDLQTREQYENTPLVKIKKDYLHCDAYKEFFDNIVVIENYPMNGLRGRLDHDEAALSLNSFSMEEMTNYDLTLSIALTETIGIDFIYREETFEPGSVERLAGHFNRILADMIANPGKKARDIELLSEEEKRQILYDFNDTATEYPGDRTIHQLFEARVERAGDWCSVSNGRLQVTYGQLNQRANRLAHDLQEKGVGPETVVAIMIERSVEMVTGILGILKAGGAYFPIDPGYPRERIDYMLNDSSAGILLTGREITGLSSSFHPHPSPRVNAPAVSLAYIIYTSGSTGRPRGVMVGHGNVVRLVVNSTFVKLSESTRVLQTGAPVFDATTFEIWGPLLNGGQLCLVKQETILDGPRLGFALKQYDINTLWLSSSLFNQLSGENDNIFDSLDYLLVGGDVLLPSFINRVRSKNLKVINGYGPTENTTFSTTFLIDKDYRDSIPIGFPISNSTAFVMSRTGGLQPVGVCGELWVGGDGLARGYLNRPELTEEKFNRSYRSYRSYIFYKTGDLARWLPGGSIEFLGRIDSQVKIRGYRIELGEIENRLSGYDSVTGVVVMVRESAYGEKSLCAYISAKTVLDMARVREFLSLYLPDYMIPSYFVQLEKIPLTANGKVDRKTLPEPGFNAGAREYVPPGNAVEKTLTQIWQEVLGIKQVGITDNFFQIGGDSIKAIQVAARLRKHRLVLSINDIFRNPDIRKLGKCVTGTAREIPQGPVEGEVALTPIQHWFFQKDFIAKHHFNHSIMLYRREGFAEDILEKVFTALVTHHDALRMRYEFGGGHVRQWNRGPERPLFDFEVFDIKGIEKVEEKITREADRIQASINLETGPLVKAGLFNTREGDHLLIVIHHLVVDGVSWRILLEDFNTGCNQAMQGSDIRFPAKTDSYRYWSRRLNQYGLGNTGGGKTVLKDLDYWSNIALEEIDPLPVDREIPTSILKTKNNDIITVVLDNRETQRLLKEVNWAYNTEIDDVLLTALGMALKDWRGVETFSVNMEGHGREPVIDDVDISRTVGWFTAIFPVIVDMRRWQDVSYALKWVKETRRRIPDKGFGYGVLKYITPGHLKDGLLFEAEPGITFNYMGQFQQADRVSCFEKNHGSSFGRSWLHTGLSVSPGFEITPGIEINGVMMDDRLQFFFDFNRRRYRSESIQSLADCYKESLLMLIRHCVSRQSKELTPSDLGYNNINLENFSTIIRHVKNNIGMDKEIQCLYPLSPMQSGMLYHAYANRTSPVYFEQSAFVIEGEIDYRVLAHSFNRLMEQYDIFRTNFLFEGLPEPLQVVLEQREADFYYEDISHLQENRKEEVQAAYLEEFKRKDRERGFDLSADRLIRWALLKTGKDTRYLVWSFHHIVMDGWCLGIVFKELIRLYRLLKENSLVPLKPVLPYGDYIKWLAGQDREEGLKYWESYLEGFENPTGIPGYGPVPVGDGSSYKAGEYQWIMEETVSARVREIAGQNQVTVNTVFQVFWGILLGKYNNCEDVVFGTVVSGRSPEIAGIENMVGLFINTLPVRVKIHPGQTVSQLLKEVREDTVLAKSYEYLSLADIQARSPLKGNLIDHIVIFENYPLSDSIKDITANLEQGGVLDFHPEHVGTYSQTNYDFNVIIVPGDRLTVNFMYNNLVYHAERVNSTGRHLKEVVRQVTGNPGVIAVDIEIITKEEKRQILCDFNDTAADYPKDRTVHQLFEEQAAGAGDRCSVIDGQVQITYGELNRGANRLAHGLQGKGVGPGTFAAIMIERSVEMIMGILGILKAGGAYLPIEPDYPQERIDYMLNDSMPAVVLNFEHPDFEFVCTRNFEFRASNFHVGPANLAYIIYTSGSTGRPKGVMVEHRNLNAYVNAFLHEFEITENTAVIQQAAYSFDTFGEEVYPVLSRGGRIVIAAKEEVMDVGLFAKVIAAYCIDMVDCSPLLLEQLNREEYSDFIKNVKLFISGGDVLKGNYIDNLLKTGEVWNTYGPTETTICAGYYRCTQPVEGNVPIGRPTANYNICILDRHGVLQPVGVPGELCIGGDGLARGYLNQPELTAEKFEFNRSYRSYRSYKTGDLGRWLASGDIEFLGRIDHQVKIRGFRIELGEIENRLLKHKEIKQAVVLAGQKGDGDRYLCAYIAPGGSGNYREYLSRALPGYMIPSFVVQLERIPLTPNGKVDRKALPSPDIGKGEAFTAPGNKVEVRLAEIWSGVLGVKQDVIGIDANFFELGGHSLKAAVLVSRISRDLDAAVSLADVFKFPTIRGLAAIIAAAEGPGIPGIPRVEKREYYPLSYNQQRMYILHQLAPGSPAYNMPGYIRLEHAVDEAAVVRALNRLIVRHRSFRTAFRTTADGVGQFILHNADIPFEVIDISAVDRESKRRKAEEIYARQAAVPFDLSKAPLFRAKLVKMEPGDYLLIFNMHHIISDGRSIEILKQEFGRLYQAVREGEDIALPPLPLQYTDFSQWHSRQLTSAQGRASAAYWKEKLAGGVPVLQLPADRQVKKGDVTGAAYRCMVDESLKNKLKKAAAAHRTTLFNIMFSVYAWLLHLVTGREDICCSVIAAGRDHPSLQQIIGFFVNAVLFKITVDPGEPFEDFIKRINDDAVEILQHQSYPLEPVFEELGMRYPDVPVSFNLQNPGQTEVMERTEIFEPTHVEQVQDVKFDLEPYIVEYRNGIEMNWVYRKNMFDPAAVEYIVNRYIALLEYFAGKPGLDLNGQREEVWQGKPVTIESVEFEESNAEPCVLVGKFENQVEKTPDKIAVKASDETFTYRELNRYANGIARLIAGNDTGEIAALLFRQGAQMIAAVLGALKAGKTYVPLTAGYPRKRLVYMLADSQASLIVTGPGLRQEAAALSEEAGVPVLCISRGTVPSPGENPARTQTANQNAYILYTSGSTGSPKGVVQTHANVDYFIRHWIEIFAITEKDNMTLFSSFGHDAAVMDIYSALHAGAALFPLDMKNRESVVDVSEFLVKEKITVWHSVPSLYNFFASDLNGGESFPHLRLIVLGGEAVRQHEVDLLGKHFPHCTLANLYGQTETSFNSVCLVRAGRDYYKSILGPPLPGTRMVVCDNNGVPVQPLETGEIVVASRYVSPGYWRNPAATQAVFAEDKHMGKIYRTGDLGRLWLDGGIQFLGRKDHQVKVRGYRIEPGEIESRLLQHPGITGAVVTAKQGKDGDKHLCAYIVADGKEPGAAPGGLREYLSESLPDYMIPSYFVPLAGMPLTPNGKLDRQALPEPGIPEVDNYAAPGNEVEKRLVKIWAEVLGVEESKLSIDANFFEAGGHSLKAAVLVSRISRDLDAAVPLADVFKSPTIRDLAAIIAAAEGPGIAGIPGVEKREYYPLSYNQQRMYILHQLAPGSPAYNMPGSIRLEHAAGEAAVVKVLNRLITRHHSLRTAFRTTADGVGQFVLHDPAIPFEVIDISAMDRESKRQKTEEIYARQAAAPFDPGKAPLFRAKLVKVDPGDYLLMFNMHHIISDGWSMEILKQEFGRLYQAGREGEDIALPPLPLQYTDFSQWHSRQLTSAQGRASAKYWKEKLAGGVPVLQLPADRQVKKGDLTGAAYRYMMDESLKNKLKKAAAAHQTTLFNMMFSVYAWLLHLVTGREDICCSVIAAGRDHPSLQQTIGFFANSVLFKITVDPDEPFEDFIKRINDDAVETLQHQSYPLELVFEELGMRYPEVPVSFNLLNLGQTEIMEGPQMNESIDVEQVRDVKFDLEPYIVEYRNGIDMNWVYRKNMFGPAAVEYIANRYIALLEYFADKPGLSLNDQREEVWRGKPVTIESAEFKESDVKPCVLVGKFENQVEKTPDKIAVRDGDKTVTYRELNRYANGIARLIADNDTGEIAALFFRQGAQMIAAVLGALKAGKTYVPLTAGYPRKRLAYMLADSQASLIVTGPALRQEAAALSEEAGVPVLCISRDTVPSPGENPARAQTANQNVYILYTSGSTGSPKGVVQTHANVDYFIRHWIDIFAITEKDNVTLFSSFGHDAAVMDIYSALHAGAALFPLDMKNRESVVDVSEFLVKEKITVWHSVPSLYNFFASDLNGGESFPHLRLIVLGGEAVRQHEVDLLEKHFPHCTLANLYGQTETSFNSVCLVRAGRDYYKSILGPPLPGTRMVVCDNNGVPVQPLETGEIVVASRYVSPGYWRNPAATQAVFAEDEHMGKIYRTGDLGRLWLDGGIQFLGRKDHQVKVRGYRIEPDEIESRLRQHPGITGAVVTAKQGKDGDKHLCAYIVADGKEPGAAPGGLREYLSESLPDYMIPSYFVPLAEMPLTPNGKLDRRALPEPGVTAGDNYAAPRNDLEKALAETWAGVLGVEGSIGIHDNFFQIGGNSLNLIRVSNRLKQAGISIDIGQLFSYQTIASISAHLQQSQKEAAAVSPAAGTGFIQQVTKEHQTELARVLAMNAGLGALLRENRAAGEYPVSPLQSSSLVYGNHRVLARQNLWASYDFKTRQDDPAEIKNAVVTLIKENALLRSVIIKKGDNYLFKEFASFANIRLPYMDISGYSVTARQQVLDLVRRAMQEPLELLDSPLFRLIVLKWAENRCKIIFAVNHLIFDGGSIRLFPVKMAEIRRRRPGKDGKIKPVVPKTTYADYCRFMNDSAYHNLRLERYFQPESFMQAVETAAGAFKPGPFKRDRFELDFFHLTGRKKEWYNEVILLAYAKMINALFAVHPVPISFVSQGRHYLGANFGDVLGDFHDFIPVFFPVDESADHDRTIERFLAFREYIKSMGLHFIAYFVKRGTSPDDLVKMISPFSFNSLIGLYEEREEKYDAAVAAPDESVIDEPSLRPLVFEVVMTKAPDSDRLRIECTQNSQFESKEVREQFIKAFQSLRVCLAQNNA